MEVGIREPRDSLNKHVAQVRNGQTIAATDHGKPVARLVPVEQYPKLEIMIADGFGHALSGREASSPTSGGRRSDDERSRRTAATMIAYVDTSSRSVILYSKWCALSRESSGCADMTPSTVLPH